MKKIIIIILAAVIVLGGAAAVYFLVLSPAGEETEKQIVLYEYAPGEAFVANIKDSNRLFKVTVVLMVDDEKVIAELSTSYQSVIRDTILNHLRSLTQENIEDHDAMDVLRVDITNAVNEVLGIENIHTCYFSDFVMQ